MWFVTICVCICAGLVFIVSCVLVSSGVSMFVV